MKIQAIAKMKKGDKQSAAFDMKRMKKFEAELGKLQGQKMTLE